MLRTPLVRDVNSMLAAIDATYGDPGLHMEFSKNRRSFHVNGIFTNYGSKTTIAGK